MLLPQWSCEQCTFLNHATLEQCDICQYKRQSKPTQSIDDDLEFAKRLQAQYDKTSNTTPSHSNSNSIASRLTNVTPTPQKLPFDALRIQNKAPQNTANSNTNIAPRPPPSDRKASRKRMYSQMESDDEDDEALAWLRNDPNPNPTKFKMKQTNVNYDPWGWDVVSRLASDWIPDSGRHGFVGYHTNPVVANKMNASISPYARIVNLHSISELFGRNGTRQEGIEIEPRSYATAFIHNEYPYFVMDFKDVQIRPNCYSIEHPIYYVYEHNDGMTLPVVRGNSGGLRGWALDASNGLDEWITLSSSTHGSFGSSRSEKRVKCKQNKTWAPASYTTFYTKFRFRMTQPNADGEWIMKLSSFKLYGTVRRRVENKARVNEHKSIEHFPQCGSNKCLGDIGNVFKILNESEALQHDECKEYMEDIPGLKVQLKDYQRRGVQWLLNMETEGNGKGIYGGLLCDEMGLGKTVQMIALMLIQKNKAGAGNKRDRSLIITPLSLIDQWIGEISKIAGANTFKYINYYGQQRKRLSKAEFEACDIVFSTTSTFSNAMGKIERRYDHFNDEWWDQVSKQELLFKLPHNFFARIIVDESHEIKNTTSNRSAAICTFAARCHAKWCLTGTPIKNDLVSDLGGMMRLLGINHKEYCKALKLTGKEKDEELELPGKMKSQQKNRFWLDLNASYCQNKVETFLSNIMLRRTKKQVLSDGFVEKEDVVIKCKLSEEEQVIYDKNANEAKQQYQKFKAENSVMRHYLYLIRMLTKLRQICDHPSLVFNRAGVTGANDDENNCNRNVMDLESNIDILQRVEEAIVNRLNEMESLIDYECPICFELTELNGIVLQKCGHIFCGECIHQIEPEFHNQSTLCPMCRGKFTQRNILKMSHILKSKQLDAKHAIEYEEFKDNNHNKANDKELDANARLYANYHEFIETYSNPHCVSSKVRVLIERLKHIQQNYSGDKVLVFSNFSYFFNIISAQLNKEKIAHAQFHGSMNRKQRKRILDQFKSSSDCNVLLISAKCASVGLNLMAANHVIFLDPRCNPGLDNQAIGRVWRIGQTKKVYVTRLILENTVEETIFELQQNKQQNEESNLVNLKQKAKLNENDYDIIFRYQPNESITG